MTAAQAVTHKALVPLDGPPRPACGGSGRSVARADEVTCPDCLRLAAERLARTAEPDEFAAVDEADAIEVSRAEEDRADVDAQADAELHDEPLPTGAEVLDSLADETSVHYLTGLECRAVLGLAQGTAPEALAAAIAQVLAQRTAAR